MHDQIGSIEFMEISVSLPLPNDPSKIKVELRAPTYQSIERLVECEDSTKELTSLDFTILYEWASKESRITGYSKLYLLGSYLANYCRRVGEPTQGSMPNREIWLLVEGSICEPTLQPINIKDGNRFLTGLYNVIKNYEEMIACAIEDEISNLEIHVEPETNLPALSNRPSPDLIRLDNGTFISGDAASDRIKKLEEKIKALEEQNQKLQSEDKEARNAKNTAIAEAFQGLVQGKNPGIAFMSILLNEVTERLNTCKTTNEGYKVFQEVAVTMKQGAEIWNSMAESLENMTPKSSLSKFHVNGTDFRDLLEFVQACSLYGKARISVMSKDFEKEITSFVWEPTQEAMKYTSSQARSYLLQTLNYNKVFINNECRNLVATNPEDASQIISAHTIWA